MNDERDKVRLILERTIAAANEMDTADALCDAWFCISHPELAVNINIILTELDDLKTDLSRLKDKMDAEAIV